MDRLGLGAEMRSSAKKLFSEGKASDFPIDEVMEQFRRETHRRTTLIQMFLEIQLQSGLCRWRYASSRESRAGWNLWAPGNPGLAAGSPGRNVTGRFWP